MLIKSKIVRDTILLTAMQIFLDTSALFLNVFITRKLGTEAIGILSLTGSFLVLAGILSNGNAFLCISRLVSEELGRKNSNPNGILVHGIVLCTLLSSITSLMVLVFAEPLSEKFFSGADIVSALKLMPVALVCGALSACFKGYFNACRKSALMAVGDVLEFMVKTAVIVLMTLAERSPDESDVCGIMIGGIVAGNVFSLVYGTVAFVKIHRKYSGKPSLDFKKYISLAFPIMCGSIITSVLSSTNDALIPMCLKQSGDSVNEALSRFGVFEAIVIPTLFFPSVVLCSMSGIIVSESARAVASENRERVKSITQRLIKWTVVFSVFASSVLMKFGDDIGVRLGGGTLAGSMIKIISPVVPFIYLEIVLEALIKGMGLQAFSSLNYLAEYVIRIVIVLIFVPRISFYGIVISYYASNVFGNCMRFVKVMKFSGTEFRPLSTVIVPVLYSFLTASAVELTARILNFDGNSIPEMVLFVLVWGVAYFTILIVLNTTKFNNTIKMLCRINKYEY